MDLYNTTEHEDNISNAPQYLHIANIIKEEIFTGKFSSGEKLPAERELAKKYETGRPTIREAIRALENMGLVETRYGAGSFVANNIHKVISDSLRAITYVNSAPLIDILEFREMFEFESVRLAALRRTDDQIKEMEELLIDIENADSILEFQELDNRFHILISEMTNNVLIIECFLAMNELFYGSIKNTTFAATIEGDSTNELYNYHRSIFEAIKESDSVLAYIFMKKHFDRIKKVSFNKN